ncbi:hypothetical protein RRF57_002172 [Xylaria bambusicola]|uniref:Uncharacterized protein n=1 Tax=Xylaria bambusicola TaxID=326684 RepID=A0AAN7UEW1_9PEZI
MPYNLPTPRPTPFATKLSRSFFPPPYRSASTSTSTSKPTTTGLLRRLAATPRGRAGLAAAALVGCVVDYELWTLYGAKYFSGKGQ